LTPLYKTVLLAFEENMIAKVSFIEVERMGSRMLLFGCGNKKKEL
jgi:hypothetical protein